MPDRPRKQQLSITLDADLVKRLDAVCEATNVNRSALIETMVEKGIRERETFVQDMENPVLRSLARVMASSPKVVEGILGVLGEELDDGDRRWLKEGLSEQAARGKQRAARKKASGPASKRKGGRNEGTQPAT